MLAVRGLRVQYPRAPAPTLDGLDLDVERGEVVAVLGPSGCGKTTLLRVVAGLQPLDAGRVELDGVDVTAMATHRRGVGLMFQDYALFPHRDVGANVAFGLRMRGDRPARRDARVGEVLELVGLAGFERRAVSELSGGERQRVALARALAPSPSVLMLDEPLGALDRSLRDRLVLDLGELFATLGLTVLYVTHDQGEALGLADRVVVMRAGRVVREAPPAELWADPGSPFVARFLGFTNLFPVAVQGGAASLPWTCGGTRAFATPGVPDGASTLLVRPDGVTLSRADDVSLVAGRVLDVVFEGDRWRVRVEMGGLEVELLTAVAPPPRHAPVGVRIDPAAVQVLPVDEP